jgi:hypothetical protein
VSRTLRELRDELTAATGSAVHLVELGHPAALDLAERVRRDADELLRRCREAAPASPPGTTRPG